MEADDLMMSSKRNHADDDDEDDLDEEVFGLEVSDDDEDEDDNDAAVEDPDFQELLRKTPGLRKQMGAYDEEERADDDGEEGISFTRPFIFFTLFFKTLM